jgi:hypothetical protein
MRLLIYGMQSSGASTLAFLLAQRPLSAAFVDIWNMYAAPSLAGPDDALAKVVVTTAFPLALHQERFRPDRTILMLRHPVANYRSLAAKTYRHECGFIEEKFAILDRVFTAGTAYDWVVHYEDLIFHAPGVLQEVSDLGWACDPAFLALARSQADIVAFNEEKFPAVKERLGYGIGNYREGEITADSDCPVVDWCPGVVAHYQALLPGRQSRWRPAPALRGDMTMAQRWAGRREKCRDGGTADAAEILRAEADRPASDLRPPRRIAVRRSRYYW